MKIDGMSSETDEEILEGGALTIGDLPKAFVNSVEDARRLRKLAREAGERTRQQEKQETHF